MGTAAVAASEGHNLGREHIASDCALGAGFGLSAVGGRREQRRCRVVSLAARLALQGARSHSRADRDAPAFAPPNGDAVPALRRRLPARVSRGGKAFARAIAERTQARRSPSAPNLSSGHGSIAAAQRGWFPAASCIQTPCRSNSGRIREAGWPSYAAHWRKQLAPIGRRSAGYAQTRGRISSRCRRRSAIQAKNISAR